MWVASRCIWHYNINAIDPEFAGGTLPCCHMGYWSTNTPSLGNSSSKAKPRRLIVNEAASPKWQKPYPPKTVPLAGSTRFGQISEGRLCLLDYMRQARVGGKDMRTAIDGESDWSLFDRSHLNLEDAEPRELIWYFAADEADKSVREVWHTPPKAFRYHPHQDKAAWIALSRTGD